MKRRALLAAVLAAPFVARAQAAARVVVVGGGFGGATTARFLRRYDPLIDVTLVDPSPDYFACPFSNAVIAGLRELDAQRFTLDALAHEGVRLVRQAAVTVDPTARLVRLADASAIGYDRLVLSPGIDIAWGALPGYTEATADILPHAWKAGAQTALLRRQLDAMEDGGVVAMSVPANPYRCPPGPYERASLIAWYLKTHKPRSKLVVLDAKDQFSKQRLFVDAWKRLYPGIVEWVGLSDGGKVTQVDPAALTLVTEFSRVQARVINVIPPQRAGTIALAAGVADRSGWCPIDPSTFESTRVPGIHVIGDAAIAGAMPKSAFAANAQGKVCAQALVALLGGRVADPPVLLNTCYSLIAPDEAISVAGVYRPEAGVLADVKGAGGTSPVDAPAAFRAQEAAYAAAWFGTITAEAFG